MRHFLLRRLRRNILGITLLVLVWLLCSGAALASPLAERVSAFPHWSSKPPVGPSAGDLVYPEWMDGPWRMTSTLEEMAAPLAPALVTPGFEGNRQFLDVPIGADIRFQKARVAQGMFLNRPLKKAEGVVSDRAFNGLSLARAYLGDDWVKAVKVDPENPNRQITFLKDNQQLVSTVTGRAVEQPDNNTFITTEVFQQFFSGNRPTVYLNEVENTTAYHFEQDHVVADQITAVYLSPQDPDYFKAVDQPVALYRYGLELYPTLDQT
ncbi:DUF6816 family protein [Leptothoe sp. PORK10 BA2]|uniref:DUF6816 family protein n=1 Tax=Leptothoe sp. PORK10 BA2 TaxID=3110254 RepID=UPI002B22128C|nr:hypothetical protein [Leptothoe sp. PORK10 BA2]MEA5464291.1 hypothetical protein [Leptothoe sp. PORK10 BA2]